VRLEFVRIGALEVCVLVWVLVGFVGLDEGANVVSLIPLTSVSFLALFTSALRVVAPFDRVIAKHVRVPCLYSLLDFGLVIDIMRSEAFLTGVGRRMFNVEKRILSSFVESQGIAVELLRVVMKVGQVASFMLCVHFLNDR